METVGHRLNNRLGIFEEFLKEMKMETMTAFVIETAISRAKNQNSSSNLHEKNRLFSKWILVDGKLICQWLTEYDAQQGAGHAS